MRFILGGLVGAVIGVLSTMILSGVGGAMVSQGQEIGFEVILEMFKYLGPTSFLVGGLHLIWLRVLVHRTTPGYLLKAAQLGAACGVLNFVLFLFYFSLISPFPVSLGPVPIVMANVLFFALCGAVVGLVNGILATVLSIKSRQPSGGVVSLNDGLEKSFRWMVQGGIGCMVTGVLYAVTMVYLLNSGTGFRMLFGTSRGFLNLLVTVVPYLFLFGAFHMLILGYRNGSGHTGAWIVTWSIVLGVELAFIATAHFLVTGVLMGMALEGASPVLEMIKWIGGWGLLCGAANGWVFATLNRSRSMPVPVQE